MSDRGQVKPGEVVTLQTIVNYSLTNPNISVFDSQDDFKQNITATLVSSFPTHSPPEYIYAVDFEVPKDVTEGMWTYRFFDSDILIQTKRFNVREISDQDLTTEALRVAKDGDGREVIDKTLLIQKKNFGSVPLSRG
jgi:hypothetical protein